MESHDETAHLTPRERAILKDVIVTYILSAEPVSSRAVAKHGQHGLSAATIRNTMADLEELGLLSQPHASAGRVPTKKAYHLYIESMIDASKVPSEARRYIDHSLGSGDGDRDSLMASASHLLSELSHQVGVVLTPALAQTRLKTIEFVALSERKILCVVVSTSGFVDSKVVQSEEPVRRRDLVRISNYVTENFAGLTLREIRDRLIALLAEARAKVDRILALTVELSQKGLDFTAGQDVLLDGTTEILSQPELADVGRMRCLFETFADKAQLVYLLTECMKGQGVRVLIGDESELTSELDFSLVTTTYGVDGPLGTLGVLGPSRMEYQRTIPLVHYLGERLSQALASSQLAEG